MILLVCSMWARDSNETGHIIRIYGVFNGFDDA